MIEDVCIVHLHVYYSLVKLGTTGELANSGRDMLFRCTS